MALSPLYPKKPTPLFKPRIFASPKKKQNFPCDTFRVSSADARKPAFRRILRDLVPGNLRKPGILKIVQGSLVIAATEENCRMPLPALYNLEIKQIGISEESFIPDALIFLKSQNPDPQLGKAFFEATALQPSHRLKRLLRFLDRLLGASIEQRRLEDEFAATEVVQAIGEVDIALYNQELCGQPAKKTLDALASSIVADIALPLYQSRAAQLIIQSYGAGLYETDHLDQLFLASIHLGIFRNLAFFLCANELYETGRDPERSQNIRCLIRLFGDVLLRQRVYPHL